jgi:ubiquinol-cytochrome c reductase cytochrome b subunit/menaquinol-cytochrome c reductase cytochrome b/c subunit
MLPLVKTRAGWRISELRVAFAHIGAGGPIAISAEPPQGVAQAGGERLAQFYLGRTVTAQSGCLACHLIGVDGNVGPGPELTYIGSTRSAAEIERAVISPTPPMPSFRNLPKAKLKVLVTFLSLLRG